MSHTTSHPDFLAKSYSFNAIGKENNLNYAWDSQEYKYSIPKMSYALDKDRSTSLQYHDICQYQYGHTPMCQSFNHKDPIALEEKYRSDYTQGTIYNSNYSESNWKINAQAIDKKRNDDILYKSYLINQNDLTKNDANPTKLNQSYRIEPFLAQSIDLTVQNLFGVAQKANDADNYKILAKDKKDPFITKEYLAKRDLVLEEGSNSNAQESKMISDLKKIQYPKEFRGVLPLINFKDGSHINAVLLCLCNMPLFAPYFLEGFHNKEIKSKAKALLSFFFSKMLSILKSCDRSHVPRELELDLEDISRSFRFCTSGLKKKEKNKNDKAVEFLDLVLRGILRELDRKIQNMNMQINDFLEDTFSNEDSIVRDLFCCQLKKTEKCNSCYCYENKLIEYHLNLSMILNEKRYEPYSLENLIREHFCQIKAGDKICPKCYSSNITTQRQIFKLPEILIVTFERTTERGEVFSNRVEFPVQSLDLTFSDSTTDENAKYKLFALVEHHEGVGNKNYSALNFCSRCRNLYNQNWYHFDSGRVQGGDIGAHTYKYTCCPSILFYIKSSLYQE